MATKPWWFAPLRRMAAIALVIVVGTGVGLAAVALTPRSGGRPTRRTPTPSVAAFRFPTGGVVHAVVFDAPPADSLVEPASARAALEDFLGAERDGITAHSFLLLTSGDQQDVGSAAAWGSSSPDRPAPTAFTVTSEQITPGDEQISVDVTRRPSLDQYAGFVSARATQVWHVVRDGTRWRVGAEPLTETPALPPIAGAADAAGRWAQASARCDRAATAALEGVPNLTGPEDLLGAPCSERGAWMAAGAPVTLDRAPDTESFVEAYGPDVGTWMRLVPVYGPRTHFLVAVAPLGDAWRVIGVTGDGG